MTKQSLDFIVIENQRLNPRYSLLVLTPENDVPLPQCQPGQFVQVAAQTPGVFLRRPISICNAKPESNQLWLLIRNAGVGTQWMISRQQGDTINLLLPLGNGFTLPTKNQCCSPLLVGGGVGVAPLLLLGRKLKESGIAPSFLIGARSADDVLLLPEFETIGQVAVSTEDGSMGHHGLVTLNPVLANCTADRIYCCGPAPMMKAVGAIARQRGIECEVSLENMMACGLGACLCCVEQTVKGNVCVCTEGPVFNLSQLTW